MSFKPDTSFLPTEAWNWQMWFLLILENTSPVGSVGRANACMRGYPESWLELWVRHQCLIWLESIAGISIDWRCALEGPWGRSAEALLGRFKLQNMSQITKCICLKLQNVSVSNCKVYYLKLRPWRTLVKICSSPFPPTSPLPRSPAWFKRFPFLW